MNKYISYNNVHCIKYDPLYTGFEIDIVGFEKCSPDKKIIGPKKHVHYVFHFVLKGKGKVTVNNKDFELKEGAMFVLNPNDEISYVTDKEDPWEYIWFDMYGDGSKVLEQLGINSKKPYFYIKDYKITSILLRIKEIIVKNKENSSFGLLGNLFYIFDLMIKQNENNHIVVQDAIIQIIYYAIDFINKNYTNSHLSISKIAEKSGYTNQYFTKKFKEITGFKPVEYLINKRLEQACLLLEKGEYSIKDIAYSVGFESPYYFSNHFYKKIGVRPSEYRK